MRQSILCLLVILFTVASVEAKVKYPGSKTYAYRYYLNNKQGGKYTLDKPSRFLSSKSLERRKRQGLQIDSTDLPIPENIISRFRVKGAQVLGTSRWNNTILVSSTDSTLLKLLAQLPCVKEARMVFQSPDSLDEPYSAIRPRFHDQFNRWDTLRGDPMGMSRTQIEMLGGDRLHDLNLRGKDITIAILDGGFQNADRLQCFANTRIVGEHDFVSPATEERLYGGIDHGTKVFSVLAAEAPEVMIGTAPDANYWLLRCEDCYTEMPIEEDYWTMAAEFADSVGVDIINSSLGYNEYDNRMGSYHIKDLDGQTAMISHSASLLAQKGIILCNSAGNSGMGSWKKITVPADAFDIITVGAINQEGMNAPFSSIGPTQDGRVKPDVVALGSGTTLISGRGTLIHDMGTSFSTPIVCGLVACLWQSLREKTALEIIKLVRESSSQYETPDNIFGYGLPDFWKAYTTGKGDGKRKSKSEN